MAPGGMTAVTERVAAAAVRAGRSPDAVTLVAVSKGQPAAAVLELYGSGHRDFGENRAAELVERVERLPHDTRWHFVGTLQRRKVKLVRPVVTLLHSLDRDALAQEWAKADAPPPALVQVNVAGEVQKHGYATADAPAAVDFATSLGLRVVGLMTIAPLAASAEASRRWFAALRELRDRIALDHPSVVELSMGMTDDFEVAVEEGATMIRVGRAIFGSGATGTAPSRG